MNADIRMLVEQAEHLEHGTERISLLMEADRLATGLGDDEVVFAVLMDLVEAALFGGRSELVLASFARMLALFDSHQKHGDWEDYEWRLLWRYKWASDQLVDFPSVPLERIDASFADLEKRLERAGCSLRPVFGYRMRVGVETGRLDEALRYYQQRNQTPRDGMSDCLACEVDGALTLFLARREWQALLDEASLIIAGRQSCAEVPHRSWPKIITALLETGQVEEARARMPTALNLLRRCPRLHFEAGILIMCLAQLDEWVKAMRLLERHLPAALRSHDGTGRFTLLRAGCTLLRRIIAAGSRTRPHLVLPELQSADAPPPETAEEWLQAMEKHAKDLASRMDARNGNTYCSDLL